MSLTSAQQDLQKRARTLAREIIAPQAAETDRTEQYRATLAARPWRDCRCDLCVAVGIEIIIFRGSERNKRRGFHNLYVFEQRLRAQQGRTTA